MKGMYRSQKFAEVRRRWSCVLKGGRAIVEVGATGVGGRLGTRMEGRHKTVEMMAMYSVILATSDGLTARKGSISEPSAPPKGFASVVMAVAVTRPRGVNHSSEYDVGAARTNGCAKPIMICPTIVPLYDGGLARVAP